MSNNVALQNNVIWWVRHGESIGNLYENNCEDLYPEELRDKFQDMRVAIKGEEQSQYKTTKYFDKINNSVEILQNNIKILNSKKNSKDKKNIKDLEKMINTWKMITGEDNKWINLKGIVDDGKQKTEQTSIKPPSSWLFTPTLTYIGIKQSILAGKNLFDKLKETQKEPLFITSATVRTIMTAMYAFYSYKNQYEYENEGKKFEGNIYVVPYINEHLNGAGCCNEHILDNSNSAIPYKILDQVINYIVDFVITHEDYNYKKMTGVSNNSNNSKKNKFMQESESKKKNENKSVIPLINTSYYKQAYENDPSNYNKSDINKFINNIYPNFKNLNDNNQIIIAFTHGNFINKELRKNADLTIKGREEYNKMKNKKANNNYNKENKSNNQKKLNARKILTNATSKITDKFEIFNLEEHTFPNNCSVWPTLINDDNTIKYAVEVDHMFNGFIEGGGIRINNDVFNEEKKSFNINLETDLVQTLNPSFCSLAEGTLRGNINELWLSEVNVNVSELRARFNKVFGGNNKKKSKIRKYKSNKKSLTKKNH